MTKALPQNSTQKIFDSVCLLSMVDSMVAFRALFL